MAAPHNLLQSNTLRYDDFAMMRSDGSQVAEATAAQLMQLVATILDDDEAGKLTHGGSLGDYVMAKYRTALRQPAYAHIDAALAEQFIDFYHKYENSYEATDNWFQASCAGYTQYWDCDGDLLLNWKDRGYRTVFDLLLRKPPAPGGVIPLEQCIHYGKEVRCVDWRPAEAQSRIRVECNDGSVWLADHVICTVSLGVLKERADSGMFVPKLPTSKRTAIAGLTLGTVDKIYVHFAEPFWPVEWKGFSLLWTQADRAELLASRPQEAWLEAVFGFYRVDYQPNVLCGWISGDAARQMEALPVSQVYDGVLRLIRQFVGKTMQLREPLEVKRSLWYSNAHFRGSYTYRSMRSQELGTGPTELAEPVCRSSGGGGRMAVPALQFAGEATHEHYYSTVHGAIESGWREANRLIELYGG